MSKRKFGMKLSSGTPIEVIYQIRPIVEDLDIDLIQVIAGETLKFDLANELSEECIEFIKDKIWERRTKNNPGTLVEETEEVGKQGKIIFNDEEKEELIIFHSECRGCTQQFIHGVDYCYNCKFFDAKWTKPDLNNKPKSKVHKIRNEVKERVYRDKTRQNETKK